MLFTDSTILSFLSLLKQAVSGIPKSLDSRMTYFHGFCNLVTSSFFKLGQHFSVANQMNLNSIFSTAVYLISSLTALLISSRPSIFFFFLLIEYKNVPVGSCFRVLLHDVPATILVYGSRQVGVPRNLHTQTLAIVLV